MLEIFEFQNKITSTNAEQEEIELDEMLEQEKQMDEIGDVDAGYRDGHDFLHLESNYEDGDFYPEDRDPDDFYDDN